MKPVHIRYIDDVVYVCHGDDYTFFNSFHHDWWLAVIAVLAQDVN